MSLGIWVTVLRGIGEKYRFIHITEITNTPQNKTKTPTLYHMFQCSQATGTTLDILKRYSQKGENNS